MQTKTDVTAISVSKHVHERVKRYCFERGLKIRAFVDSALMAALHSALNDKQKRKQDNNHAN